MKLQFLCLQAALGFPSPQDPSLWCSRGSSARGLSSHYQGKWSFGVSQNPGPGLECPWVWPCGEKSLGELCLG